MKLQHLKLYGFVFLCALFAGVIAYGGYQNYDLKKHALFLEERILFSEKALEETSKKLGDALLERDMFEQNYYAEKKRMDDLTSQISTIQSMVGVFEKLQTLDSELLKKYSKIYFLNENYVPEELAAIDPRHVYNGEKTLFVHEKVFPYVKNLLEDAESAGIDIKIISAFRSFGEQALLKSSYSVVYGTGASQFSADQGYSEHQLGTAIDFTTGATGADFYSFEGVPAYAWLLQHAYRYGFVLSYPDNNDYYRFEPWHWRFVGRDLAEKLHSEGKYFYDMDQRILDTYLISFFD
ncbi:MAG: M15 family metallopeptidase [bacterium]|nr:M15 family metallopeptidase [bacterium]